MPTPPSIELLLRQAQRGVGKINARSSAIQNALAPYAGQAAGYFQNAQNAESSLGNALSQGLTAQGQQLGGEISSSLSNIQAPGAAIQQYGQGTATTGAQSGAAVGALSSADLERLGSQGSAEQIYAAALPRLAALAGDQERRNFLAQMQEDLQDLALQEAQRAQENAQENARYNREWAYKVAQEKRDRKRENYKTRIEIQRYKKEQAAQAKRDRMAARAAAAEYGWDVYDTKSKAEKRKADAATSKARAAEAARHNRATEANAARDDARAAKKETAKSTPISSTSERKAAFSRAREYAKTLSNRPSQRITRQKARVRLWTEFGPALVNQGYDRKVVNSMISNALDAAGY